jgi:hypothetical protein
MKSILSLEFPQVDPLIQYSPVQPHRTALAYHRKCAMRDHLAQAALGSANVIGSFCHRQKALGIQPKIMAEDFGGTARYASTNGSNGFGARRHRLIHASRWLRLWAESRLLPGKLDAEQPNEAFPKRIIGDGRSGVTYVALKPLVSGGTPRPVGRCRTVM